MYIDRLRRVGLQHHTNAEIMYNKSALIDSKLLFSCAAKNNVISKPLPNQYLESNSANSSIPIQLAAHLAAMVYVLCVDCDSLRVPAKVRNVQLVRAAALDACDHVPPDHFTRVSVAHKAAVAHALLHHHSSIAILEEDSQINGANGVPDFAHLKVQINKLLATDKLLRFGAWPWELVDSQGACKIDRCKCHQDTMIPWCYLKQGCPYVTESSFYMMPKSLYSRFIETGGYIDGNMFASFDSMLASPPITLQRHSTHQETGEKWYASDQINAWNKYERACTVRLAGIEHNFSKGTMSAAIGHNTTGLLLPNDPLKLTTIHTLQPVFVILAAFWMFYFLRKDLFLVHSVNYIVLAGSSFCVIAASMNLLNKAVVEFTHTPCLVTNIQMTIAVIVLMCCNGREVLAADRRQMLRWCVVPVAYAIMLNSSMLGYQYLSLSQVTVFRNLAPVMTICVEGVIMPPEHAPKITFPVLVSMAMMVCGAFLFAFTERAFSWTGLSIAFVNMLFAIADRVLQRRLLVKECKDLPLSACMVINNFFGVLPSIILSVTTHELQHFHDHAATWQDPGIITLVIMSGFMGLFIGFVGLMCQQVMTATSFQILQNMSKVMVVGLGVYVFGDKIDNAYKVCGMFLSIAGSLAYGYSRALEAAQQTEKKTERSSLLRSGAS